MRLKLRKYRILEIMEGKGINSLKELGICLDVEPTNLSTLLNNRTNFTRETLERLIEVLDCQIEDILEISLDDANQPL
ncbi:putative transcriptional regulator [uncultured Mediterranean phage uvDeep-CGR2-KM23-C246]|jgi:DNA-binding Xre family transcriptional regulator|nr:putative transcriptional regulator [uncultured Mediterranean phage uvDeep-CGR2-KM23-C246]